MCPNQGSYWQTFGVWAMLQPAEPPSQGYAPFLAPIIILASCPPLDGQDAPLDGSLVLVRDAGGT